MWVLETVVRNRRELAVGKAINAIARDLHVSRKLIGKAIRAPEGFRTHKFTSPKRARDCDILNPSRCATVSIVGRFVMPFDICREKPPDRNRPQAVPGGMFSGVLGRARYRLSEFAPKAG